MIHDDLCPWLWPTPQACACPLIASVRADEQLNIALTRILTGGTP